MSSTCKKLAAAAAEVPLLPSVWGFSLAFKPMPPRLISGLLLSWAPNVLCLEIHSRVLAQPRCAEFIARAERLQRVAVFCRKASISAMDGLLSRSQSIVSMMCQGYYLPCTSPPALQKLQVHSSFSNSFWDSGDCGSEPLIANLGAAAVQLRTLHIDSGDWPLVVASTVLPKLEVLHITFTLQYTRAMLPWLGMQPYEDLHLIVIIDSHSWGQAQAVQQLQQLRVTTLRLELQTAFSPTLQEAWQQLSISKSVCIIVRDPGRRKLELKALPRCPFLIVHAPENAHGEIIVHWAAAKGWRSHTSYFCAGAASCNLDYIGFPSSQVPVPQLQVRVGRCVQVTGLPPLCICKKQDVLWPDPQLEGAELGVLLVRQAMKTLMAPRFLVCRARAKYEGPNGFWLGRKLLRSRIVTKACCLHGMFASNEASISRRQQKNMELSTSSAHQHYWCQ